MSLSTRKQNAILAFEKGYRVLPDGSVLSPKKNVISVWKSNNTKWPYSVFHIKNEANKKAVVAVHLLAAYQKFGLVFAEAGLVVRHLNGLSLDNSLDNIELGSQKDNVQDIPKPNRLRTAKYAASFLRKLTEDQIYSIRRERSEGFTYSYLANKYAISRSTVHSIVNMKTYK